MPEYTFSCKCCGKTENRVMSMRDILDPQLCVCGTNKVMRRKFYPPQINNGFEPWYDIGSGRIISSKNEQNEIMKREGKVLGGHNELSQEAVKNKKQRIKDIGDKSSKELKKKVNEALRR